MIAPGGEGLGGRNQDPVVMGVQQAIENAQAFLTDGTINYQEFAADRPEALSALQQEGGPGEVRQPVTGIN